MGMKPCPRCSATHPRTTRERRLNGYTVCGNCRLRILSSEWDASEQLGIEGVADSRKSDTQTQEPDK